MKVLFLDFDGVLNSEQSSIYFNRKGYENGGFRDAFCPIASSNLLSIIEEHPDLKIVVSSTWRIGTELSELQDTLHNWAGVPKEIVIGKTPVHRDMDKARGLEIQAWLDNHPEVTRFVIVDDDSDMVHLTPHLVKTHWRHGLTRKDAVEIIDRFYFPWKQASGWDLTRLKDQGRIDKDIMQMQVGYGITYWGRSDTYTGTVDLEVWALAKTIHWDKEVHPDKHFDAFLKFDVEVE